MEKNRILYFQEHKQEINERIDMRKSIKEN